MTIGGWIIFAVIVITCFGIAIPLGISSDSNRMMVISISIALGVSVITLLAMLWWFGNTAAGARALKTQESNLNRGMFRKVSVYDVSGDLIYEYSGFFDVTYDEERILFDDESGLRHVIYYPTGTVIIDELGKEDRAK